MNWDDELRDMDFSGLEPSSFGERLAQEWRFCGAARLVAVGWPMLDRDGRGAALGSLAEVVCSLLPDATKALNVGAGGSGIWLQTGSGSLPRRSSANR